MIKVYSTAIQIVLKNVSTKQKVYSSAIQLVIRQLVTNYKISSARTQVVVRRLDMPQHSKYSVYSLPLEVAYEKKEDLIFTRCDDPAYFFSADHQLIIYEGKELTVSVIGGVPPYYWAVDAGSVLILSDTITSTQSITVSALSGFPSIEYLTVEDSCGSQLLLCISLCRELLFTDLVCNTTFLCDDFCDREIIPFSPDPDPDPDPETYDLITILTVNGFVVQSGVGGILTPSSYGHSAGDVETVNLSILSGYLFSGWWVSQAYTSAEISESEKSCTVMFRDSSIVVIANLITSSPLPPPPDPPPPGETYYTLITGIKVNGVLDLSDQAGTITPGSTGYDTGDFEEVLLVKNSAYTFVGWEVSQSYFVIDHPEDADKQEVSVTFVDSDIEVYALLTVIDTLIPDYTVYSAEALSRFLNLNILVITISGARETQYLLWDLSLNVPAQELIGPNPCSQAEWNFYYSPYFNYLLQVPDQLEEGTAVGLGTINKWNLSGPPLTLSTFGYPVQENTEWGCGNSYTRAQFAPMWCEDSETIVYGGGGGVNWSEDAYNACYLMPPWDSGKVTVTGSTVRGDVCDLVNFHVWPNLSRNDRYIYKSSFSQSIHGEMDIWVSRLSCPPWSDAKLDDSDIRVSTSFANLSQWVTDTAVAKNESHGYFPPDTTPNPGDWGSVELSPVGGLNQHYGYVRTQLDFISFIRLATTSIAGNSGCENYDKGQLPHSGNIISSTYFGSFEYMTWWGQIGNPFIPTAGYTYEEVSGHRIWRSVRDYEFQASVFIRQRTENKKRKINVHGTIGKDIRDLDPKLTSRYSLFEEHILDLVNRYYSGWKEDNYLSGSKIDASMQVRFWRSRFESVVTVHQLPLEIAYEKT